MAMLNPPHPGDFIRTEIIEPLGLTVKADSSIPYDTRTRRLESEKPHWIYTH